MSTTLSLPRPHDPYKACLPSFDCTSTVLVEDHAELLPIKKDMGGMQECLEGEISPPPITRPPVKETPPTNQTLTELVYMTALARFAHRHERCYRSWQEPIRWTPLEKVVHEDAHHLGPRAQREPGRFA